MRRAIAIWLVSILVPGAALAWTGSPAILANVTDPPSLVAASHDGAYGEFVAWQAPSSTTAGVGTLRLLHLTADGEGDPAWPADGMVLGGGEAARSVAELLPDGSGGVFAWWLQGTQLRVTRVLASGQVAAGWTAGGRSLGALTSPEHRPWVEPDGLGGLWLGWFQGARTMFFSPSVVVFHIGPDGSGAGGWPASPRGVPLSPDDDEWVYAASFARAEDGGVWALVATGHVVDSAIQPGDWRLARLTPAGQPDPSLPPEGVALRAFAAEQIGFAVPRIAPGAVIGDGAGGVFTVLADVTASGLGDGSWSAQGALSRWLANGSPHPQSPASGGWGWWTESPGWSCTPCLWADFSMRLVRDATGELFAATPEEYTHVGHVLRIQRLSPAGASLGTVAFASGSGVAIHPDFGGGFVLSTFDPSGPTHAVYDPGYAYAGYFDTGSGQSYRDETFSPFSPVYVASDVAPLPDGGALVVWARVSGATGLYAVRVGANGSPLDAGPPAAPFARGLRLVREGTTLRAAWNAGAAGVVTLVDVAGRQRARLEVPAAAGSAELPAPGGLAPGVYFARLVRNDGVLERARAVVLR